MTITRRHTLLSLAAMPVLSFAQDGWPSKPVKLIVPFAPGGPTDTVARLLAERMQALWKQPVVLDYKPGGGTMVGTIISQAGVSFSTAGNVSIVTLNGRAMSLGASVTLVNTVINVP